MFVLEGDVHVVVCAKGLVAIRTLSRSGCPSFFDALFAEYVATRLNCCIFEVDPADGANSQGLNKAGVSRCFVARAGDHNQTELLARTYP